MAINKYLARLWKNPSKSGLRDILRARAIEWRKGKTVTRVERPTRLDRAHALGYRAKKGYVVVRVRIRHGGLRKRRPVAGRRQKKMGVLRFSTRQSIRKISEGRAQKRYPNLKVLNSYWLWEDGKHEWYEVILADPALTCN